MSASYSHRGYSKAQIFLLVQWDFIKPKQWRNWDNRSLMVVSKIVAVCRLRILWRWRRKLKLELFTCSRSNIRIINVLEVKLNGGDGIMGWYPVDNRSPLNTEDWVPKLKVECCFSDDLDRWSKGAYSIIFRLITLKRHLVVFFCDLFRPDLKTSFFCMFFFIRCPHEGLLRCTMDCRVFPKRTAPTNSETLDWLHVSCLIRQSLLWMSY